MIVCLCEGMNDASIRKAIEAGCDSVSALARRTRVGTHCGACGCDLKRILAEVRGRVSAAAPPNEALPLAAK